MVDDRRECDLQAFVVALDDPTDSPVVVVVVEHGDVGSSSAAHAKVDALALLPARLPEALVVGQLLGVVVKAHRMVPP